MEKKNVAIVGGGIAGLSAAFYLTNTNPADSNANLSVTLFESTGSLGGALRTSHQDGFLIENSGDMFVSDPNAAIELCRELNFEDELIGTNQKNRFSSIVRNGKLIRIPTGFSLLMPNRLDSVLKSPLLSLSGKWRFLMDYFIRPSPRTQDESLTSFATRHYGQQTFERIIQPLVAGIYSAAAEELSVHATMSRFVEMEREHGSLIRAARVKRRNGKQEESSGARYGMFMAPQHGMQSMVNALVSRLDKIEILTNTKVNSMGYNNQQYNLEFDRRDLESKNFDALIVAANAKTAAATLNLDSDMNQLLGSIKFGSMIVVTIACDAECFGNGAPLPEGFGFVVPEVEQLNLIACSYASNKFAGRAPDGKLLLRCFIGGRNAGKWKNESDEGLIAMVKAELHEIIGFRSSAQTKFNVFRWLDCMPQYLVNHLDLVAKINNSTAAFPKLALAGNSYDGVGIPACIASGKQAAEKILGELQSDNE